MFTADLLHDETAEIARLAEQVTALRTQVDVLAREKQRPAAAGGRAHGA
jgi:hypothetical protein